MWLLWQPCEGLGGSTWGFVAQSTGREALQVYTRVWVGPLLASYGPCMVARTVVCALALALLFVSPARAEFLLTRGQAVMTAQGAASYLYDLDRDDVYAKCRPWNAPSHAADSLLDMPVG